MLQLESVRDIASERNHTAAIRKRCKIMQQIYNTAESVFWDICLLTVEIKKYTE